MDPHLATAPPGSLDRATLANMPTDDQLVRIRHLRAMLREISNEERYLTYLWNTAMDEEAAR